jgi:hypothetical protein
MISEEEEEELAALGAAARFYPEAVRLVETVRDNHPAKYGEFLRVLDDHSNQRYAIHT